MPKGNHATARLHRDWLRNLPRLTGLPITKVAQESKVAPSTLTRPLQEGDDGTSTLNAGTISKIVDKFGVPPPAGVTLPLPGARPAPMGFGEEAVPYEPRPEDPLAAALEALIGNRKGVVPWTLRTRALELMGFLPGDVVLVDLNAAPKPGDAVCAQVYDWKRMKAETVMRAFERAPPVELLVTRSLDQSLQVPLIVDGERVIVKGVLLPFRLRHPAVDN